MGRLGFLTTPPTPRVDLAHRLAAVAGLAQALPVASIPEERAITTVRHKVIDLRRHNYQPQLFTIDA